MIQMAPLKSVCEIIMGQAPSGDTYNHEHNGWPLIAGASDFGKISPLPSRFTTSPSKLSKVDDIIICIRATIGDLNWSDKEYCLGRGVASLRVDGRKADKNYIWRVVEYNAKRLSALGRGATFKQISKPDIADFEIPLPPLEEQKRIAAILDQADDIRRKRQHAIDRLNQLGQAIFHEMFGDPKSNRHNFPLVNLGELALNEDGRRVPVKSSDRSEMHGKYPYYGASGIIDYVDNYIFEGERLLIGEDGANLLSRSSPLAFIAKGQFWVNNHAHVLSYNGKANLRFLEYFIERTDISQFVSGSAQPKITQKQLNSILVPYPPIQSQNRFADAIDSLIQKHSLLDHSLSCVNKLFASLQHRAFAGEL